MNLEKFLSLVFRGLHRGQVQIFGTQKFLSSLARCPWHLLYPELQVHEATPGSLAPSWFMILSWSHFCLSFKAQPLGCFLSQRGKCLRQNKQTKTKFNELYRVWYGKNSLDFKAEDPEGKIVFKISLKIVVLMHLSLPFYYPVRAIFGWNPCDLDLCSVICSLKIPIIYIYKIIYLHLII